MQNKKVPHPTKNPIHNRQQGTTTSKTTTTTHTACLENGFSAVGKWAIVDFFRGPRCFGGAARAHASLFALGLCGTVGAVWISLGRLVETREGVISFEVRSSEWSFL